MRRHLRLVLLALLGLALPLALASGCGGGGGSTTAASTLTADQWRQQADAICADIDKRTDAIAAPSSEAEIQSFLEQGLPIVREGTSRLAALKPPEELRSIQDQAVALQRKQIELMQQALDRIKGGESATAVLSDLSDELDAGDTRLEDLARQAGLEVCGKDDDDESSTSPTDTSATSTTATIPTTGDLETDRFLRDVQAASAALTAFGDALRDASDPAQIKAQLSDLRAKLGEFDQAIAALDDYTLDNATLEGQRSRLVAAGPAVSDVLRSFVDAAASGDLQRITAVLPDVAAKLQEFASAAQP